MKRKILAVLLFVVFLTQSLACFATDSSNQEIQKIPSMTFLYDVTLSENETVLKATFDNLNFPYSNYYISLYKEGSITDAEYIVKYLGPVSTESFTFSGLESGKTYKVRLSAANESDTVLKDITPKSYKDILPPDGNSLGKFRAEAVKTVEEFGLMTGITDTEFNPNGNITRGEAAEILSNLFPTEINRFGSVGMYSDIPIEHKYYEDIVFLSNIGVFKGNGDNSFKPDENITIAEFVTALVRLLGYESLIYTDLEYPRSYVYLGNNLNLLKNVPITMATGEYPLTRIDAAVILSNFLDIPKRLAKSFNATENKVLYIIDESSTYRADLEQYR